MDQYPRRQVIGTPELHPSSELPQLARSCRIRFGWRMTLNCGHIAERPGVYNIRETAARIRLRSAKDLKPPPRAVQCRQCPPLKLSDVAGL